MAETEELATQDVIDELVFIYDELVCNSCTDNAAVAESVVIRCEK